MRKLKRLSKKITDDNIKMLSSEKQSLGFVNLLTNPFDGFLPEFLLARSTDWRNLRWIFKISKSEVDFQNFTNLKLVFKFSQI